jgi:hypothetical protein
MTYAPETETETAAAASPSTGTTDRAPAEPEDAPLPVVDDPGVRVTRPREVRRQARRRFLQTIGAVGVGIGLAFTDGLSTRFARRAGAAPYEMWGDCRGFFDPSTTCTPTTAYFGSDNCDANAWHRHEYGVFPLSSEAVLIIVYYHLGDTCAGRNAWLWSWSGGTATKCSDGRVESWIWNPWTGESVLYGTVFSVCRTTGFF